MSLLDRFIWMVAILLWINCVEPLKLLNLISLEAQLSHNQTDLEAISTDFGRLTHSTPTAILRPSSPTDIVSLLQASYSSFTPFVVSARGHGHSIHGQANAQDGVVVDMSHNLVIGSFSKPVFSESWGGYYVDVWGGELWIDVLKWTLQNGGLAPRSWTDYLYLSVGGTLSNAGISGQTFHFGPQISNVYELDVVTGKGELVKCSNEENQELFHSVLGGLGQFGIITRARIVLQPAPARVKWIRMLYSDFEVFTRDQEHLISLHGDQKFDYVEGFVIAGDGLLNNWRSSFFSPSNPVNISSIVSNASVLYCLEVTKNYNEATSNSIDEEVEGLMKKLHFIPSTVFTSDIPYVDFLNRVHKTELKLRTKGLWEVPHPWLNLFVPASKIVDFDQGVFKGILGKKRTNGPILIYPMNKDKWDERSSVIVPEEEVFYLVAFLRSAVNDSSEETQTLEYLNRQNDRILRFCHKNQIGCKQYLPYHHNSKGWQRHFGKKWERFLKRKMEFDPKGILGTGQGIFQPTTLTSTTFSS